MPIESICDGCSRKLRVADEHAGKKARCPHCGHIYDVPTHGGFSEAATQTWQPSAGGLWELRIEDGRTFGPVSKSELDEWVKEGRITATSELRSEESGDWIAAGQIYPTLTETAGSKHSPSLFADGGTTTNPYASPASARTQHHYTRPHRGATILTLGIVGLVCCQIMGPFAWIMGNNDLAEMRNGQMDPSGRGITQAGMIMGMIGTGILVLNTLGIAIGFLG